MRGDEFMRNEGRKEGRKEGFWMTREKYERKERTRIGLMICAIIFVRNNSLFAVCLESTMERNPFRLHFRLTNNPFRFEHLFPGFDPKQPLTYPSLIHFDTLHNPSNNAAFHCSYSSFF